MANIHLSFSGRKTVHEMKIVVFVNFSFFSTHLQNFSLIFREEKFRRGKHLFFATSMHEINAPSFRVVVAEKKLSAAIIQGPKPSIDVVSRQ